MLRLSLLIFVVSGFGIELSAATVSDTTPDDFTEEVDSASDYLGVVDVGGSGTSITVNSQAVTLEEALGTIEVNDVVGRDIDGLAITNGGTTPLWTYNIVLPGTADPGTGLTNIAFSADLLFSDDTFDGVAGDTANDITFSLFTNGGTSAVDTVRFEAFPNGEGSVSLTDVGGSTITTAQVQVAIQNTSAFNTGNENFAVTNAALSADFQVTAVPEPSAALFLALLSGLTLCRRRN